MVHPTSNDPLTICAVSARNLARMNDYPSTERPSKPQGLHPFGMGPTPVLPTKTTLPTGRLYCSSEFLMIAVLLPLDGNPRSGLPIFAGLFSFDDTLGGSRAPRTSYLPPISFSSVWKGLPPPPRHGPPDMRCYDAIRSLEDSRSLRTARLRTGTLQGPKPLLAEL